MRNFNRFESNSTDQDGERIHFGWMSKDNQFIINRSIWKNKYHLTPVTPEADFKHSNLPTHIYDMCRHSDLKVLLNIYYRYLKTPSNKL